MFLIIGIKLGIGISIPGQQNASIALLSRSCLQVDLYLLPSCSKQDPDPPEKKLRTRFRETHVRE